MKFEHAFVDQFGNEAFGVCPVCDGKASVIYPTDNNSATKFICTLCGTTKEWYALPEAGFTVEAWYQTNIKGHTLYANNLKHLAFLKAYIEDKLRERTQDEHGWSNKSIQSRLPKWMLSAKNRDLIIKKITELETK